MKFLWPSALLVLALIPLLILLFVWRQRRRRRFAVRYSSLSLVRAALPAQSRLRRYLPMGLFLLALTSLVVGLARPVAVTRVPAGRATVMLALDVSGSMRQDDISPSRLGAAKQAAMEFIDRQKNTNQVGIVAFAGIAQLVQMPSTDPEELKKSIRSLTTGRHTAIGDGIVTALDAIADFAEGAGAPAAPAATGRVPAGHHRPADGRGCDHRHRPAGGRPAGAGQQGARLHHWLRHQGRLDGSGWEQGKRRLRPEVGYRRGVAPGNRLDDGR